jgi:hypothetical protein
MKRRQNLGQATIEYVLMIAVVFSIASLIVSGIRGTRDKLWKRILCEVSAPCVGCVAPEGVNLLLQKSGVNCPE